MAKGKLAAALAAALACLAAAPAQAERARPSGRWLVVFEHARTARSSAALSDVLARAGAVRAGRGVPREGIATVRGGPAAIRALRRDPRVESVSQEWYRPLRRVPNDFAVNTAEDGDGWGALPDVIQWALGRQRFYGAWDVTTGAGARVAVLDTGLDGSHPELAGKVATADAIVTSDPLRDSDGHGTHVSGLACAATDNVAGIAGAGWGCRLHVIKVSTSGQILDEDIVAGIARARQHRAPVINMSFGGGPQNAALDLEIERAFRDGIVMVAAASNCDREDQEAPASHLQQNDSPNINAGRGLVVTAVQFDDQRAYAPGDEECPDSDRVGYGSQVSLASYGFVDPNTGPPGLISTFSDEAGDPDCGLPVVITCRRRNLNGDDRYAYEQGTSMAAPQVAALAALVADLNPWLTLRDKLTLIKRTARRSGGWSSEVGWGILNASAAIEAARRIDRRPPSSRARSRRRARVLRGLRRARVRVRWSGSDRPGRSRLVPSGVRSYDLYMKRGRRRYRRIRRGSTRRSALLRLRPGVYRFYTRARDAARNREAAPRRADVRVVVKRPR